MNSATTIIDKLKALTPTLFENVVFDLVASAGLRNAIWRTPGSDGGRDIEGEMATPDFSGYHAVTKWYVECKRYATAVDWPTVWEKISYADSHGAEYLLVVTTAALSPQCKTEVSTWNSRHRRPIVRFWEATDLERALMHYPGILVKYGLTADNRLAPASFLALAEQTAKVVQAAYGVSEIANQLNPALEAASALSELLTVRIRDAETGGKLMKSPFVPAVDLFDWLTLNGGIGDLADFDRHGLRAVLALLRHVTLCNTATATLYSSAIHVTFNSARLTNATAIDFLTQVAFWGDLELRVAEQELIISRRL
jgi:hypothetical protein